MSSLETSRNPNPPPSNLTSVPSTSMLSVSSKAKRKAPQPPSKSETSKSVIPESPEENTLETPKSHSPEPLVAEPKVCSVSPLSSHSNNEDTAASNTEIKPKEITEGNNKSSRQNIDKSLEISASSNHNNSLTENSRISKLPCSTSNENSPSSLDQSLDPEPIVLSSSPNYQSDTENSGNVLSNNNSCDTSPVERINDSVDVSSVDDVCTNREPSSLPAVVSEEPPRKRDSLHQIYSGRLLTRPPANFLLEDGTSESDWDQFIMELGQIILNREAHHKRVI